MEVVGGLSFFLLLLSPFFFLFLLRTSSPKSNASCPSTYPLIGNTVALLQNRHRFYDWVTDLLCASPSNTINVRGPLLTRQGICTAHPANVAHILKSNFPNYIKGPRFQDLLSDLLGSGIFVADGDLWSHQRKIAAFEFNTKSLRSFVAETVRSEITARLLPSLAAAADASSAVDLQEILQRFAFDNICNLAFGDDPKCLDPDPDSAARSLHPFIAAFDEGVEICSGRCFQPTPWIWKIQRLLNVGSERRLKRMVKIIDDYAMRIIDTKLRNRNRGDLDLLSRFMFGSDEQDPKLDPKPDPKFLRDIVISFVLAGKDSTSTALTWFFWLLSENPRCERRIYAELLEAAPETGILPTFEELKGMNYLQAAISEALRLYPPVPLDSRVAVAEDVLPDGTVVGAGWFADYCAYAMGRMERLWGKDCREFVPERWLDRGGVFAAAEQFQFPVFHGGPRVCLGREMAYLQMKAVAAAVIREFEMEVVRRERPEYKVSLTLKMKGGLPVRLRRRRRSR